MLNGCHGNGYVQLRRGIHDHKHRPKLPPLRFAAYVHLILDADSATGVVNTSAKSLAARYGFTERSARDALEELEKAQYIRRFSVQGKHGEYPVLVNRYMPTCGAMRGMLLDAYNSTDSERLCFVARDDGGDGGVNDGALMVPPNNNKNKKENSLSSPSAPEGGSDSDDLTTVKRVWDFYLEKLGKNPKLLTLSSTRKQKGLARLVEAKKKTANDQDRAEKLLCVAVDALAASPWHMGENPAKRRYDSWEKNLFKSQEQFEQWLIVASEKNL